jgi:hypothetical protein
MVTNFNLSMMLYKKVVAHNNPKRPMLTFSSKRGNQIVQRPTKRTKMIVYTLVVGPTTPLATSSQNKLGMVKWRRKA